VKSDSFVSVVYVVETGSPLRYEEISAMQAELSARYSDYEIVLIGQGSIMDSSASRDIGEMLKQLPSVRYIQLVGTVSLDVAWAAGLENAIGDFVVLFNHEMDPISVVPDVVDICKSGYDVVVGTAERRKTLAYTAFRYFADRLLRAIDYQLPKNATSLRCLSRRAVNAVTSTGRFHHQFYLRIQKTGYPSVAYNYQSKSPLSGEKSLAQGVYRLLQLMVFNSLRPLRWMSVLGFLGALASFVLATYSVLIHLVSNNVVPGWTTVVLSMSMLFMFQFIMMALFGEYLSRLLDDRSERGDYSIAFEKNSLVMVDQARVNVM
jgi:hypothetical protein